MKYKVMVVEDEKIEREAAVFTVHLARQDVEVVCAAENGIEALRLFRTHLPDIVVMDVDLPGISGLEAIQEMQKISPLTQYIILSAYNIFNYAQKALKLGVHEYLLKPCKAQELAAAIDSVIEQIDTLRSRVDSRNVFQKKINEIRPVLESECITSIATLRENISLNRMFDFLEIRAQSGFVFIIKTQTGQRKVLESVKANLETMGITCISDIRNSLCVFIALSEKAFTDEQIQELIQFLSSLLEHCSLDCCIGVGHAGSSSEGLHSSYEEALRALSHADAHQCRYMMYQDSMSNPEGAASFDMQLTVKRICAQMALKDKEGVKCEVTEAFAKLMLLDAPRDTIDGLIYRMYVQTLSIWNRQVPEEAFAAFTVDDIRSEADLRVVSNRMIQLLCCLLNSQSAGGAGAAGGNIAAGVVDYIQEHYAEELNLNQMANHFMVTPFYLSKLVKRHTGKTFTEYLTYYRISKAKSMILEGTLSIKEITYAVGFNSQNYFAKVFKKYTGFTPSEFRVQEP